MSFPSYRLTQLGVIACTMVCSISIDNAQANLIYEFVQESTGDTLAYWELTELPASYEQVVGLTFTPAGEAIFGLGEVYQGVFDHHVASAAFDDGMGGLQAGEHDNLFGGGVFDGSPPVSTLAAGSIATQFTLLYIDDPGGDHMLYQYFHPVNGNGDIQAYGDWQFSTTIVPEPSSLALAVCGLGSHLASRRRRSRLPFTS